MQKHPSVSQLAAPLLDWYGAQARVLPWRSQPEPYRVWVSEIMLQQTRVEAVKGYYERFLTALPTIQALAGCGEERLLKLWEGLGYYSRARNLQKAAQIVCERHGGELPADYNALLALPGVGEYTAGAIASIAFGIAVPCVDGNVLRVFARLRTDEGDIASPAVKRELRAELLREMPHSRPGDFNQALMELGATVCLPGGAPLCLACPVGGLCQAKAQGRQLELPVKSPLKERTLQDRTLLVVLHGNRVALRRRAQGPLKGMWELPGADRSLTPAQALELASHWGMEPRNAGSLPSARHVFTHREWRMTGYLLEAGRAPGGEWTWADRAELEERYALPAAFKVYVRELKKRLGAAAPPGVF